MSQLDRRKTSAAAMVSHVLVVEDCHDSAAQLELVLTGAGYRVSVARDAGQALASSSMLRPDFVLLDLVLPGGSSGFEVWESLKRANRTLPVLVLSAIDLEDSRRLAKRVGADGYLAKPVTGESLLQEITSVVERVWRAEHLEGKPVGEGRVRFVCSCGKKFRVSPAHRGRALSCPGCGEAIVVPLHD